MYHVQSFRAYLLIVLLSYPRERRRASPALGLSIDTVEAEYECLVDQAASHTTEVARSCCREQRDPDLAVHETENAYLS